MIYFILIPLFLLGLCIGSFLNCVIYRLHIKESFLKGFSHCPHCQHKLNWQDLIPVLSFLILRGKCRYCKIPISLQYPLVELATAVLFVLTTYNLQLTTYNLQLLLNLCYQLFVVCCLLIIFVYDLKYYIIQDKIVYPAIVVVFLYRIISNFQFPISITHFQFPLTNFYFPIYAALGAAGFFFLIWLFSKGKWLGFGDVKLAFLIGLFLGFPEILAAFFLAFFIGAIIGIGLIVSGKKQLSSQVPFAPFLVIGTFLALFFGQDLISWYSRLFL